MSDIRSAREDRCGGGADLAGSIQMGIMRCPICRKPVDVTAENPYRPFCSERCRTVDLGTWASETYRVPGKKVDDTEHPDDLVKKKGSLN